MNLERYTQKSQEAVLGAQRINNGDGMQFVSMMKAEAVPA